MPFRLELCILVCLVFTRSQWAISQANYDYQEDLAIIQSVIESVHPAPFEFIDRNLWLADIEVIKQQIKKGDISEREWIKSVARLIASLRCAHTRVLPSSHFLQQSLTHLNVPPVFLEASSRDSYLASYLDAQGWRKLNLISIDGESIQSINSKLLSMLPFDGLSQSYAKDRLLDRWSFYYAMWFGSKPSVKLGYQSSSGKVKSVLVKSISFSRFAGLLQSQKLDDQKSLGVKIYPQAKRAYLKISSFLLDPNGFKNQIRSIFRSLSQEGVTHLLLDLRLNEGGDVENALTLLSFLVQKASHFSLSAKAKTISFPHEVHLKSINGLPANETILKKVDSYLRKNFQMKKQSEGFFYSKTLPISRMVMPEPEVFLGRLSVIVSGRTLSSALLLADFLHNQNRATIVSLMPLDGKRSDGYNGNIILRYQLPFSGLMIDVPMLTVRSHFSKSKKLSYLNVDYVMNTDPNSDGFLQTIFDQLPPLASP